MFVREYRGKIYPRRRTPKGWPLADRMEFWIIPEPNSGCWLWSGSCDDSGYGHIKVGNSILRCHRVMWEQEFGTIPEGMMVLHKCDTPACCNPDHLFIGDNVLNMVDMVAKGRSRGTPGELNRHAKLTKIQVFAIIRDDRVHQVIADEYGVSQPQISNIKRGDSWTGAIGRVKTGRQKGKRGKTVINATWGTDAIQ